MRQKLDVADVEQRTKIRAKYLRALENEEWDLLPGPTFVRTFLRTYAEVVGVDPHLLIEEYRAHHEPPDEPELAPLAAPSRRPRVPRPDRRRRPPRGGGPPGRGVVLVGAAVAVIIFLLILGLVGGGDSQNSSDKSSSTVARTETAPKRETKRPARKAKPKPAAPTSVTVRIAPTVPTYVCLDAGDGTNVVFEGILDKPRNFKNASHLRVNLGKRSVTVRANGKAVKVVPSAEPLGLDVTRTGAKEITQGTRPCA